MDEPVPDLEAIFSKALEIPSPEERAHYLEEVCRNQPHLIAEVEKLIRADESANDFLQQPAISDISFLPSDPPELQQGTVIGPYKILEKINSGGMGTVYMAEQSAPIRRKVALKVIKHGLDSPQAIARFETEFRAMALMNHPNIVSVFDAGTIEDGRPYFVMELVRGFPITSFCDTAKLSIRQRLELFTQVCKGIQHAHQKGMVHRDLKPSNVLVAMHEGDPIVKIIDFGIVKTIGQQLTDKTLYTGFTQLLGTTAYMSPEQVELSGIDIDTRSDVYSLGVLLYELITGTTPFDIQTIRKAAFDEARRIIREDDPPRPSMRLSSLGETATPLSANRGLEPRALKNLLRGDLDWIVMKSLEKKRDRRYETANELARDVQRYLADQPVDAGPPSAWYRLSKFARRHRAGLIMGGVIAASLLTAAGVSLAMAVRAWQSESDSQAVQTFFRDRLLQTVRPKDWQGGLGRDVALRTVLDAAEPAITDSFNGRPVVEAGIRDTLGMSYFYLGLPEQAIQQLSRALELRQNAQGKLHPDALLCQHDLASAYADAGKYEKAIELAQRVHEARKSILGPTHPDTLTTLNNLGVDLKLANRVSEAVPILESTLELRRKIIGRDHPDTLLTQSSLGTCYLDDQKFEKAELLLKPAFELSKVNPGPTHPDTLLAANNLAVLYASTGRMADAIPVLEFVLNSQKTLLGADHPVSLGTQNNLAAVNSLLKRNARAIELYEEALPLLESRLGKNHPTTLLCAYNLAMVYRLTDQSARAVPLLERALAAYRVTPGLLDEGTLTTMNQLASTYLDMKRYSETEILLRECLRTRESVGKESWWRFHTMSQLGGALAGLKREVEAEPLLTAGYEGLKAREGEIPEPLKKYVAQAGERVVALYDAWNRPDQAAEWRKRLQATTTAPGERP